MTTSSIPRGVQIVQRSTAHEACTVLTQSEKIWYYLFCIVTLGWPYFNKLVLKRAMLEALLAHQAYNTRQIQGSSNAVHD